MLIHTLKCYMSQFYVETLYCHAMFNTCAVSKKKYTFAIITRAY